MQSKQIKASGVDIYTESFGDPADPPLLLIMGAMASGVWIFALDLPAAAGT